MDFNQDKLAVGVDILNLSKRAINVREMKFQTM